MSDTLRLFAAFEVPPDHLREVQGRIAELRSSLPAARWTPPENQHVTLRFFGPVPQKDLGALEALCEQVGLAVSSAELKLTSLGAFPNARRARVLWLGLDDPTAVSDALHQALEAGARALGFSPEERAFTPHLTLARLRTPQSLPGDIDAIDFSDLTPFPLGDLVLYRSHLSPKGARYEVVRRFPLG